MNCSSMDFQVSEELGEGISVTFQCFPYLGTFDTLGFFGGVYN